MKIRWNPKFGLNNLENDLLISTISEGAQWFFFQKLHFKISASSWGKWVIVLLSIQTFKNTSFWPFVLRGHQEVAKNLKFKSLSTKSSYSSFFSPWCTDFKNVIFEKIHWAPSEVAEVKRSFSRSLGPNFGFHLVFSSFRLEFSSFWV